MHCMRDMAAWPCHVVCAHRPTPGRQAQHTRVMQAVPLRDGHRISSRLRCSAGQSEAWQVVREVSLLNGAGYACLFGVAVYVNGTQIIYETSNITRVTYTAPGGFSYGYESYYNIWDPTGKTCVPVVASCLRTACGRACRNLAQRPTGKWCQSGTGLLQPPPTPSPMP